jgi:cytochrome P450
MGFLSTYDALHDPREQLGLLEEWIVQNPDLMFDELRAQRPVFITPGPIVVSKYRDVVEVASLDNVFSVKPYGVAMMRDNGGPNFILGMDDGPEFEHDLSLLHLAVRRTDLDRIRDIVARLTAHLIDEARPNGNLDITDGFARLIPALFVGEYFGVPGPEPGTLMNWIRAMFTDIFLNFTQDPRISAAGVAAGKQFRDYVDALITSVKANKTLPDTVIGRLIALQAAPDTFTDSRLRDNLIGCATGVVENTNSAVVNIIDYLLDHPQQLSEAASAARAGDDALLQRYVLETLRFHAPAPILVRLSLTDHVLGKGSPWQTDIPAGKIIFAATSSAMMDETELDSPAEFRLDRPAHHYLHFGWGIHQCLGKYISQAQVTQIVKGLVSQQNLRRSDGEAGKLLYSGPFPKSFSVAFDAGASVQTAH